MEIAQRRAAAIDARRRGSPPIASIAMGGDRPLAGGMNAARPRQIPRPALPPRRATSSARSSRRSSPRPGEHFVEIGPGRGALTVPLLASRAAARRRGDRPRARRRARTQHRPRRASIVHRADALKFDFGSTRRRAGLAAARRQPALQHLHPAAVSPARSSRPVPRPARHAAAGGGRAHDRGTRHRAPTGA